ncbi:sensor histidine kinase [Paenibacillus oralis]|uniref:histidine kinase n=1 Tax=Paenibacillus oralis TaxID=2490856 RepID=A0A3P3UAB9_9BACL|nr:HAMP domain-containing sensor histidine kinase [Paenibacillus oralis]RRJ67301.1 sensor histidine kinase [Paenibacillus oralis]
MKHWPMAVKIWVVFASLLLCLFLVVALILPYLLKSFFTGQIFGMIRDSQQYFADFRIVTDTEGRVFHITGDDNLTISATPIRPLSSVNLAPKQDGNAGGEATPKQDGNAGGESSSKTSPVTGFTRGPNIGHLVLADGETAFLSKNPDLPEAFLKRLEREAAGQVREVETHSANVEGDTLLYVIFKIGKGSSNALISYAWANYRNEMVGTMFCNLLLLLIALMLLSSLPCIWLARYLSRPLDVIERQVKRMSEGNWHEPFESTRRDEIGRLSRAFDGMRRRLLRQDEAQQSLLQHISHELKTPVMIIRNYAQSIVDGIYPRGSLAGSVDTILQETDRLMERVYELLSLSRLQYVSSREVPNQWFDVGDVLQDAVERLRFRRPELRWDVESPPWRIHGNADQWKVVFENLLDNQIRYANQQISIVPVSADDSRTRAIEIRNDGPQVKASLLDRLFDLYRTGADGRFGLGLAIVRQILNGCGAQIEVFNEETGVVFRLTLPKEDKDDENRVRE